MSVEVRYPGRVCLLGEHCDWAGGASLVVPMPLGLSVRAEPAGTRLRATANLEGELLAGQWPVQGEVDPRGGPLRFVPAAAAVLAAHGIGPTACQLHIGGDLPPGRGFSSSAALSLGLLDALARCAGKVLPPETLAELAFELEHDRLGVACGRLDPLACALARPVWIQWFPRPGGGFEPLVQPLVAGARFHLVAACFGRPRDTEAILSTLQRAWEGDLRMALQAEAARRVHTAIRTFADQAASGAIALIEGRADRLGHALDTAQQAYEDELADGFAALRAPQLWRTCQELRQHGALGAKFTGAGGDGSIIALMRGEADALAAVDLLKGQGLLAWSCPFGEERR